MNDTPKTEAPDIGTPETFEELLSSITPEIHENLKRAIELGRWADGQRLRPEQVELCMQAVIAYEARNLPPEERVAYIERTSCKSEPNPGK